MLKVLLILPLLWGVIQPTYSSQMTQDEISSLDRRLLPNGGSLWFPLSRFELSHIIKKSIDKANPKHHGLRLINADQLSREVVRVAECYEINPLIFTGLIWRESNFKPDAVSETGAVGLTQMTSTGVQEVMERLSLVSPRKLVSLRALVKKCSPDFLDRVPIEIFADTLSAWKNTITFFPKDALIVGATLFKIYLISAAEHSKNTAQATDIYQLALEHYNGEPDVKKQFAWDVLHLAMRMIALPEVAPVESKFLSQIVGF